LSKEKYITSSCVISEGAIYKDGKLLFDQRISPGPGFLLAAYRFLNLDYPKFHKMDNLCKSGWLAAEVLLTGTGIRKYERAATGVVFTNANSSLDTDKRYIKSTREIASPALFVYTLPNIVIGEICIRHQLKGENAFFITEKFDASFLEQYVSNLVDNGSLDACICGWTDFLDEDYKTVLFLVEKEPTAAAQEFTKENLYKLYG
jgi:hypothetical protein